MFLHDEGASAARQPWECSRCHARSTLAFGRNAPYRDKRRLLCPCCLNRAVTRAFLGGVGAAAVLALVTMPLIRVASDASGANPRPVTAERFLDALGATALQITVALLLTLMILGLPVCFHEFGHAVVGRLLGFRVPLVAVGHGPLLARFRVGETQVEVRVTPAGGHTIAVPTRSRGYRLRGALLAFAGVVSEVALFLVTAAILWRWRFGRDVAFLMGIVVTIHVVLSLVPRGGGRGILDSPSDGKRLRLLLRADPPSLGELVAGDRAVSAMAALGRRDTDSALAELAEARRVAPNRRDIDHLRACALIEARNYASARELLLDLVATHRPALEHALNQNALAWVDLLLDDPALLPEALAMSSAAFSSLGWMPTIQDTRGFALILDGRVFEGAELVERAYRREKDPRNRVSILCVLSIAANRQGRPDRARADLETARRLDPACPLVPRAEAELATRGPAP